MGNHTDQDKSRQVGDRLAPPTIPNKDAIKEDRAAVDAEHYEDMIEKGAAQEGEGKPGL